MHHSLITIAVAFVLGLSLDGQVSLSVLQVWWALAGVTAAVLACQWAAKTAWMDRLLIVAVALAGLLRAQMADPLLDPRHFLHSISKARSEVLVEIADDPVVWPDRAVFTVKLKADAAGGALAGLARVEYRGPTVSFRPLYGQRLLLQGWPGPIPADTPSTLFGRQRALALKGILGQMEVGPSSCRLIESDRGNPIVAWAYGLRQDFVELLQITHEARTAGFLKSLLLGDGTGLQDDVTDDFRRCGTIHVLAQSGQHVAILALVCYYAFRFLPLGRHLGTIFTLLVLGIYTLMAACRASILRAVVMAVAVLLAQLSDRRPSPYNGLALAALLLLAYDPAELQTPGFQLSFAAMIGLIFLTPWLMQQFDVLPSHGSSLVATSLAAYAATAPLVVAHFGALSLVAPLANLFVLPLVSVIMPTAILALACGMVNMHLAYVFAAANYGFVDVLLRGLDLAARVPMAEITLRPPPQWFLPAYYMVFIVLGDFHNITRRIARRTPAAETQPPSADWSWMLASHPMDPLMHALQSVLAEQSPEAPSDKVMDDVRARLGDLAARLDPLTLRYLGFAVQQSLREGTSDGTASVIAYLLALERELDSRVFRFLKIPGEVARSEVARTHRRGHIGRPPRSGRDILPLPLQNELLWCYLVPTSASGKGLVQEFSELLRRDLAHPEFYLEPSRLALSLDRVVKKFYRPVVAGESANLEQAQLAAREILGGADFGLLREIVAAGGLADEGGAPEERSAAPMPD